MAFIATRDIYELEHVIWTCRHCGSDHVGKYWTSPHCTQCHASWEWIDVLPYYEYEELVLLAARQERMTR
jgi:hypothetical protein